MIITDMHLPKMNGHDLLAVLKEDDIMKTVPVVMLSNSNSETDIKLAYNLAVNSYIVKPHELGDYKETMHSFWNFWGNAARLPDSTERIRQAV
jgi:CheY-like chemotaxis protein